jgi:type IV secretory pathway VirD2 relaxase
VKLSASGAKAARLHLRYIEREGVEPDGSKGILYGADGPVQRQTFEEPRLGEAHQFRLVVSPEDGNELDMTAYIRSFMMRVEKDLGRPLEWAAVNHFDTDHPHAHIVIRGVDRDGYELRLERHYISNGLRWRAQELATQELGLRQERDIERTRRREVTQERFTSLDRGLERRAAGDRIEMKALLGRERPLLIARLEQLEAMGLAERTRTEAASWTFSKGWQRQLRDLGSRGDIIKQMHAAMAGDPSRYHIVKPGQSLSADGPASQEVTGRIAGKGLSDELKGSFYVAVEAPDGRGYHVALPPHVAETLRVGDVVTVETKPMPALRPVDHAIAEHAGRNHGVYVAERSSAEGRRLGELERVGLVSRHAESAWRVPPDLPRRIEQHPANATPRHGLTLNKVPVELGAQVRHEGPVWLDRVRLENLAPYGFGAELRRLVEQRREGLRRAGIRHEDPDRMAKLEEVERRAIGIMGRRVHDRDR